MAFTKITTRQHLALLDFIRTARGNGITDLRAALSSSHDLIRTNRVAQIRVVKDSLAEGADELGNRVRLTPDLRVIQS